MEQQLDIFGALYEEYKITKPIRLIEFFAGYGSQNLALKYLGANYESWKICEWATKSIQAYNDLHHEDYTDYSMVYNYQEILDFLYNKGVSMNYNNPMTLEQIKRKGEKWCRNVFNNIIATNNLVNIQQASGKDLDIVDTDKYDYVLTYSFPCQDLSLAGKGAGMEKGSGTRSGMLWEVERILKECYSLGTLPKILLLENVTQLHSKENMPHLQAWLRELEKLGYSSYWQDMNSADYGVPQHRDRTFVVSILGDYYYEFPKKFPLKLVLADMLEDEVDEKYYLSDSLLNCFMSDGTGKFPRKERFLSNINRPNQDIANAVTTLAGNRPTDNFVVENSQNVKRLFGLFDNEKGKHQAGSVYDTEGLSPTLDTAQGGYRQPCIKIPDDVGVVVRVGNYSPSGHNASSIVDVQGIAPTVMENHGTVTAIVEEKYSEYSKKKIIDNIVKEDVCGTITANAMQSFNHDNCHLIVEEKNLKQKMCNELIQSGRVQEYDVVRHSYSTSRMSGEMKDIQQNNMSPTLDTRCDCLGVAVKTKNNIELNLNTNYQHLIETLQFNELPIGEVKHLDCYNRKITDTYGTLTNPCHNNNRLWTGLRIRKLTPKECGRLMGVRDSDIDKMSKNQSNASLYHLFGDSIVVDVLMNIFKKLI